VINHFADDCVDQLLTMVAGSQNPCHLLIDGVFLESLQSVLRGWPTPISNQCALFNERANGDTQTLAASPWLLPIAGDAPAVRELLVRCDRLPAVTLIRSPSNITTLLGRLKRWTVVNCGGVHFNFRYPDTRRLPGVFSVMTKTQRSSLFGNDAWSYIGRDGRWHHLPSCSAPMDGRTTSFEDSADPELTDAQFATLLSDSEADEQLAVVWLDLPENAPARTTALPSEVHEWTKSALAQADRLTITDMPERTRLCAWVLSGDPTARLAKLMQQTCGPFSAIEDNLVREGI